MAMDADIKRKWVEALRGGKYEQGRGVLRDGSAYCCLGVLCDLIDPEAWHLDVDGDWNHDGGATQVLPDSVTATAGLDSRGEPSVNGTKLWGLNDGTLNTERHSFVGIANLIEGSEL